MKTRFLALSTLAGMLILPAGPAFAAEESGLVIKRPETQRQIQPNAVQSIELATPAERMAYRNQLRSLKSIQERRALRTQFRKKMQERARERERAQNLPGGVWRGEGTMYPRDAPRSGSGTGPAAGLSPYRP